MYKKLYFFISLVIITLLFGCDKNEVVYQHSKSINNEVINQQSKSTNIVEEAKNPADVKSIKPGIWASYYSENKTDFCFYYFYDENISISNDYSGYSMDPQNGNGLLFKYIVDNNGLLMTEFSSEGAQINSSVTFKNENKFTITRSDHLLDSETLSEDLSPMTFVFLDDTQNIVCEKKF